MLTFSTPTILPIEAAISVGVSVKTSDNSIGKFGTGLKYAIAGILRLGGYVSIRIEYDTYEFSTKTKNIRGKDFEFILVNGEMTGLTTEYGKHWEPWQLFRELASNTLDEGGYWVHEQISSEDNTTLIEVDCVEIVDAEINEEVFMPAGIPVFLKDALNNAMYTRPSKYYYYRGIRAGSHDEVVPYTINSKGGQLTEDRTLDRAFIDSVVNMLICSAQAEYFTDETIYTIISAGEGSYLANTIHPRYFIYSKPHEKLIKYARENRKQIKNGVIEKVLYELDKKEARKSYKAIPFTQEHWKMIAKAEELTKLCGIDTIPRDALYLTDELSQRTYATTDMVSREVWFSTHLFAESDDFFLQGYLEEAAHLMTGYYDQTREFQTFLFAVVTRLAKKLQNDRNTFAALELPEPSQDEDDLPPVASCQLLDDEIPF